MARVTSYRLNRLWGHLLQLEKETGEPLLEMPRREADDCPILNFAPSHDKNRHSYHHTYDGGEVTYVGFSTGEGFTYRIFKLSDSDWWDALSDDQRSKVTRWVQNKVAERGKK